MTSSSRVWVIGSFAVVALWSATAGARQQIPGVPAAYQDDAWRALKLFRLSKQLKRAGRYRAALAPAQRSLELLEDAVGPNHHLVGGALNQVGRVYQLLGAHKRAIAALSRALKIYTAKLGSEHPYVGVTHSNLGISASRLGRLDDAKAHHEKALSIAMLKGSDHPGVAHALNNLAAVYHALADTNKAEALYRRSLAIRERAHGKNHPLVAITLNNLASALRAAGRYAAAEPLFLRALSIQGSRLGASHPALVATLNNLGVLYNYAGKFRRGLAAFRRAQQIAKGSSVSPFHLAAVLNNTGELHRAMGDFQGAEPLFRRALEIVERVLGPRHVHVASALNNLAGLHNATGKFAHGVRLLRRALRITERRLGPRHPKVAVVLNSLGRNLMLQGKFKEALPPIRRSLEIRLATIGPENPITAHSYYALAELLHATGRFQEAAATYEKAIGIREKTLGVGHPDLAATIAAYSALEVARGNVERAIDLGIRFSEQRERSLPLLLSAGSEQQKHAFLAQVLAETHLAVSLHTVAAHDSKRAARLAFESILRRKGRVLEAVTQETQRIREELDREGRKLLDELQAVRTEIAGIVLGSRVRPRVRRRRLPQLERKVQEIERRIAERSASYRQLWKPPTLAGVQAALPAGFRLVEMFRYFPFRPRSPVQNRWGPPRYVAYVVTRDKPIAWVDLGPAVRVERAVNAYRRAASTPFSKNVAKVARALAKLVYDPLAPSLGKAEHVLISPDGALNLVPFAALMDAEGKYLIAKRSFSYLTSGRRLMAIHKVKPRQGPTILANPAFGPADNGTAGASPATRGKGLAGRKWPALPASAREAERLRRVLPGAQVLLGSDASEERLRMLHGPSILHVATHGFFLPAARGSESQREGLPLRPGESWRPNATPRQRLLLRSGLVLAGANRKGDAGADGILTALEASSLDLRGTQLVVLSACETGVGEVASGDGVYGLRRALEIAGAERQVMSLWKVEDSATQQLMATFYERLKHGMGATQALRLAQLELIRSKYYKHPFFWGSFFPAGEWRPLETKVLHLALSAKTASK